MGILYAISILAFAALLWAALSIASHIRHSHSADESALLPNVPPAVAPNAPSAPAARPVLESAPPAAPKKVARPFEFFDPREFHSHPTQHRPVPQPVPDELETYDLPIHGVRRQPPRPVTSPRISDRSDLAYFNKDLGDLNDPEPSNHARTNPRPGIKKQA